MNGTANVGGELRRNPLSGTVVVINHSREKGLEQLRRKEKRDWSNIKPELLTGQGCPFELGHEKMTPPEVRAYRSGGTKENEPGWWVRVVPNLAPALDPSLPSELLGESKKGPFLTIPAFGYHYVIVESPEHQSSLAEMPREQIREVLYMWRELTILVASDRNIKHVFLFENFGPDAGASQPHPHSQLIASLMIPPRVMNELRGARTYYEDNKECFYCAEQEWERRGGERIIAETPRFLAWCPFTSKTPYQVIISPKEHQSYFANISIHPQGEDPLTEFAHLLQEALKRIKVVLNDPDYNLYFHTAPANQPELGFYHWHCQIEPITEAKIAGFEKGSGIFINPRSPENAAKDLREASLQK